MSRGCLVDAARMSRGCSADFAPITGLVDVGCLATAYVTYLARAVCVLCRQKIRCARCILGSRKQYKYEVHRSIRSLSFCALRAALLTATRQQPAWPAADSFIDFKLVASALESKFRSPAASCGILAAVFVFLCTILESSGSNSHPGLRVHYNTFPLEYSRQTTRSETCSSGSVLSDPLTDSLTPRSLQCGFLSEFLSGLRSTLILRLRVTTTRSTEVLAFVYNWDTSCLPFWNPVGSWWPYPENRILGSSLGTPLVPGDRILTPSPNVPHLAFRGFL